MLPTLRKLRLELALDCPLRCAHCSASAAPGHPLAMMPDVTARLVREFAAMGGEEITFTGGEPLVRADLGDLLTDAVGHGLSTVVFTSGTVHTATGPAAASLDDVTRLAPMLGRAVFSVYSTDPARHDRITRTPGSLTMTREAIGHAVAAGIRCEFHVVPTRANYRDIPALAQEAASSGVRAMRVIRYVPQGRGRAHRDELHLTQTEQRELRAILRTTMEIATVDVRIGAGFGYLLAEAPPCTAAVDELVVAAGGQIYPCSGFSGYHGQDAVGSVRNTPLADVWRDAPYLRAVRDIHAAHATQVSRDPECHPGCPAQKAIDAGHLTSAHPDPDAARSRRTFIVMERVASSR